MSDLIESFGARHAAVKLTFIDGNPADYVDAVRADGAVVPLIGFA